MKASIGGRMVYGEVLEIRDRVVYFNPLSRGAGWRHATASQIVGHWRKAGRRRGGAAEAMPAMSSRWRSRPSSWHCG